jgi:hypothetical protein
MNILIGGMMRSGKTRLATRLFREYGFCLVQTDPLILALQQALPEMGIGQRHQSYEALCDALQPFLVALLKVLAQDASIDYVVEGYYIRPKDIEAFPTAFAPFFLGYNLVSRQEKIGQIRAYARDHPCYTSTMADETLQRYVESWLVQSKALAADCARRNLPFLDTSAGIDFALATIMNQITR